MLKKELRKKFLQKRLLLSKEEIEFNSRKILQNLMQRFDLRDNNLCTFLPIETKNEINTFQLFDLKNKLNFKLYGTKWNILSNDLNIHRIDSKTDLIINEFQIPEPKQTDLSEKTEIISIVLVPLLCFDHQGNRVGYGKGVYDKFLVKFNREKTLFIGLSFFEAIDNISDIFENDVKLHYCITPKTIYQFEK